jgi:integrase
MASIRGPLNRRDGSTYTQVLYRLNGKQTSVSFGDHAEALAFCELANRTSPAKALDVWVRVDHQHDMTWTVAQCAQHHIDHLNIGQATLKKYREYLRNDIEPSAIGDLPLGAVTRDDIALWIGALAARGNKHHTIANKHGFLSGAFNAAVAAGKMAANPCEGQHLPATEQEENVFLSHEQFALLRSEVTPHWQPLVEFLVASGCRWSEATALRPANVDRNEHTVRIVRAWRNDDNDQPGPTKTRKSRRTINVPSTVLDKLDYSNEWLFVNRDGTWVKHPGFHSRVWTPAVQRAGLDPAPRIHDLRHTCASWMIAAGVPLPAIQQHLGHESITTTIGVYGHLDRTSARAASAAIAQALGQASPKL